MQTLIIKILSFINMLNEGLFSPIDSLIEKLPLSDWFLDAIVDSIHMLPFLFIIFVIIEIIEYFYAEKMTGLAKYSKTAGPLFGSLAASFPQCGFSVIASTLYTNRLITKGTLLAVYLSTSDEAIPVILAEPSKIHLVVPLLLTKIIIAFIAGYFIDFIPALNDKKEPEQIENINEDKTQEYEVQEGCCRHHVNKKRKRDLFLHPLEHTFNVFIFILLITVMLNYFIFRIGGEENLGRYFLHDSLLQPIVTAVIGLIPNCAVSIAITIMYLKGALGFGSVISGLSSGAGLGLLILIKRNRPVSDTVKIIALLLFISILSGLLIQLFYN